MKRILLFLLVAITFNLNSQTKKIQILSSEISTVDESRFPGATILIGNVKVAHEGATLDCKRALLYREKNVFQALGEVVIEQGDSIIQYSDFANYDANTKIAKSWGNVEVNDKEMKLSTDTLYFNRTDQILFYPTKGIIKDKINTLTSNKGTYYLEDKKFTAKTKVNVVNPDNILDSDHLDYYTNTNLAYIYGPSTVFNRKDSTKIYAERGFFDTDSDISYFVKNAKLFSKDKTVEADSLYYDKKRGFASATNRIKVIDTIQNMVVKGNYAEIFELQDSLFIIKKPVAISIMEKDSLYIHGDTILVTGKPEKRIIRTYHNVKIFKENLQGKCDSIHTNQETGLTKMFVDPILWSGKSQITGDSIHFKTSQTTNQLDSLFVLRNSFIIQKDSLDPNNFNQIKGRNIFGKFEDNDLRLMLVKGNAESLYYNRNDETLKLETITKEIASDIEFLLENNEVVQTKYFTKTEGNTFPPSQFPEEDRKFRGFIWREDEQPKKMEDIFIKDKKVARKPKKKLPEVENAKAILNTEFKKKRKKKRKLNLEE
ncbi:OstA-like protein [Tenacibaculum sp. 190524A05c]|uniref:Lipopolysaccharide export system protein LptA n=1 Tax=Tenacibaculum platacis TaxID=3137852 RepID=A0ABM9P0L0_9FLAO